MPRPSLLGATKQQQQQQQQRLTLKQLASYDDILTDALVDHTFYWTTIPKNRPSYHPSRGIKEDEVTQIIQSHLVVTPHLATAEAKLLGLDGLKRFCNQLATRKEKDDFKVHLRRYMAIYLPDCPFEVNATNRYTIVTQEASITARCLIKRNHPIRYLVGIQVVITPEEEADMTLKKKDFSMVISSRRKNTSLFMGPARFANHDCHANARLVTKGQAAIELIACRDIQVGEEITVTYGANYFGQDNCECLCQTCETRRVNGWALVDGQPPMEESPSAEGYSLRRRRRESTCDVSRSSSVTPTTIRPRVPKGQKIVARPWSMQAPVAVASPAMAPGVGVSRKRRRDSEAPTMDTPPATTPRAQKKANQQGHCERPCLPVARTVSCQCSNSNSGHSLLALETSSSSAAPTDATTPDSESAEPETPPPDPGRVDQEPHAVKQELEVHAISVDQIPEAETTAGFICMDTPCVLPTIERVSPPHMASGDVTDMMTMSLDRAAMRADPPPTDDPPTEEGKAASTVKAAAKALGASPCGVQESLHSSLAARQTAVPMPGDLDENMMRAAMPSLAESRRPTRLVHHKQRQPGDYLLTPVLLAEPNSAWIHCMNCNTAFVQPNAYFTKSSCPRCERHSKLYGYPWPKTQPCGPGDEEARVLDHRTIHRFLHPEDEAKARGRMYWKDIDAMKVSRTGIQAGTCSAVASQADLDTRTTSTLEPGNGEEKHESHRRSGRSRRPSRKLAAAA